jgi:hypothetical protein
MGFGSGIRDPRSGIQEKPIPDPGTGSRVKKAPDPGSVSATLIFKDKKSKRSHMAVGIKVFLTGFAW